MSIKLSEAYSIGKQKREAQFIKSKDILEVPGPGQYQPSVKTTKGKIEPSWSLSKDQREKIFNNTGPGPGSYQSPSKITDGPKYHLGIKTEYDWVSHKGEPGPGNYDPRKPKEQISYSIRLKSESKLSQEKTTPGPGHYLDMRDSYYKRIPGSKIGSDTRKAQFLRTATYDKPPPGQYKTISFVDRQAAPKFGFGTSKREKDYLSSTISVPPGPGHYLSKSTLGDGSPVATMPGRRKDLRPKTGKDAPGAGSYDPNYKNLRKSSPNFSISKKVRDGEVSLFQNTPGIGSYFETDKLTKTHSATWRIGTEKRPEQLSYVPKTPGPGQYKIEAKKSGPAYHLGGRESRNVEQSPGPGHYKSKTEYLSKLTKSPSFSVGTQPRVTIKELNKNPGPGIYQSTKNSYLFSGPKFGFGSSQRMPVRKSVEPGPGSYKIPTQVGNVPQYSMPNRPAQSRYV